MNRKETIIYTILFISAILFIFFLLTRHYFWGPEEDTITQIESEFFLNNTTKVFTEQLNFRDKAISEYDKNLNAVVSNRILDSIFYKDTLSAKIVNRFLLPKTKTAFAIPLNNYTILPFILVKYDTFYVDLSIDENKINAIIEHQNITPFDFEKVLRHQDYIKTERRVVSHLSVLGTIIFTAAAICLYFLLGFLIAQEIKDDASKKPLTPLSVFKFSKKLDDSHVDIENIKGNKEDKAISKKLEEYNENLEYLKEWLQDLERRNKSFFIIENIVAKAEKKMKEVQSRSNLMLAAGLAMAFVGVSFFYFMLPNSTNGVTDISKILALSVRPTLILIFIESISWYLLKQHKNLLADYKYYHSICNKKMNYLASHKLINEDTFEKNDVQKIIPLMLLTEELSYSNSEMNKDSLAEKELDDNTPHNVFKTLFDKIMSKI